MGIGMGMGMGHGHELVFCVSWGHKERRMFAGDRPPTEYKTGERSGPFRSSSGRNACGGGLSL